MKSKMLIINGPNLNFLGKRETSVYGHETLDQLIEYTEKNISKDIELDWFQTNNEGEIVNKIQELGVNGNQFSALIINPGAYSHTSVAILDALRVLKIPKVEVHLSNTNARESFRAAKLTGKAADCIIEGFGRDTYIVAINGLKVKGDI